MFGTSKHCLADLFVTARCCCYYYSTHYLNENLNFTCIGYHSSLYLCYWDSLNRNCQHYYHQVAKHKTATTTTRRTKTTLTACVHFLSICCLLDWGNFSSSLLVVIEHRRQHLENGDHNKWKGKDTAADQQLYHKRIIVLHCFCPLKFKFLLLWFAYLTAKALEGVLVCPATVNVFCWCC